MFRLQRGAATQQLAYAGTEDCVFPPQSLSINRHAPARLLLKKCQGYTTNLFLTSLGIIIGTAAGIGGFYLYRHQYDPVSAVIIMPEPLVETTQIKPPPPPVTVTETPTDFEAALDSEVVNTEQDATSSETPYKASVTLDPLAPCPARTFSCVGGATDNIKDAKCTDAEPVWGYFSTDKGVSWTSAGCFATLEDATKSVNEARKVAFLKPTKQDVKPVAEVADKHKLDKAKTTASNDKREEKALEQSQAQTNNPAQEEPAPATQTHTPSPAPTYHAQFKGAFGLVLLEERRYHSAEMKQKALELWDKEQKILEPDGTINDKYVVKPQKPRGIPGF